jgi:serine/threonine protein kinase
VSDTSPSSSLQPGFIFAGYRIEQVLDRGGMAVVYKAIDVSLERTVALKVISPGHAQDAVMVSRFKEEARVAAGLDHPNIVPIYAGGEHEGVLYLAMRYVEGSTLREEIRKGPLDVARILRILTEVASALDAMHAKHLVHRDVKPANILLTGKGRDERAYVADFGIAKRLGGGNLTRPGDWVGTPDYLAPEQIRGEDVDARTDVYSLGCVLYEMLTGAVPYQKTGYAAKLYAHVTETPPPVSARRPSLGTTFDEVFARATAKTPDDRYPTAGALASATVAAAAPHEAAATRVGRVPWADDPAGADQTRISGRLAGAEPEPAPSFGAPPSMTGPAAQHPPYPAAGPPAAGPGPGRKRKSRLPLLALVTGSLAACAIAAVVLLPDDQDASSTPTPSPTPATESFPTSLQPIPTNHVDGAGEATVQLQGRVATVDLRTSDLVDGERHLMHIHADGLGQCPPASAARRHNGRRAISASDGVPFFGRPLTSLTTRGDTGVDSILAFPRFPVGGAIEYRRRITLEPAVAGFIRQGNATIVVHGIDHNRNGRYDDVLRESSGTSEQTAPALCGILEPAPRELSSTGGSGSRTETFVAVIGPAPGREAPSLLCPLHRAGRSPARTSVAGIA